MTIEDDQIAAQQERMRGKGKGHTRTDNGREKRLVDQVLIAAVLALVAALWVLNRSVAVLQTSDDYQNRRIDELRSDVKTLEGRNLRGIDLDEPDAPHK